MTMVPFNQRLYFHMKCNVFSLFQFSKKNLLYNCGPVIADWLLPRDKNLHSIFLQR